LLCLVARIGSTWIARDADCGFSSWRARQSRVHLRLGGDELAVHARAGADAARRRDPRPGVDRGRCRQGAPAVLHRLGLGAGQWLRAVLSAGVLDLFFAFSLLSALGFVATNRGAVADHRAAVTARFELTRRALGEAEVRLAALGPTRPEGQIEAELAGLKQDRRWHFSQACTMATGPASRDFCAQIFAHEGERAQAQAAEALRERIEVLRDEMTRAQAGGAGEDRDPQAGLIARLSGLDVSEAQQALSALMAVLVEIGAAATLYLAAGPSGPGRRHPAPEAMASETPRVMTGPEEERFRLPASGRVLLSG